MAYRDKDRGYWVGETRVKTWTGEIRKKKQRGFRTKREALEWENKIKILTNPSMEIGFADFVEIYFRDKESALKERSIKNKRYMIERHIVPYFERKKMSDITAEDILLWQKEMLKNGFSESYLRMVQNQLTALFTHASKIYDLSVNPCKKVPKIGRSDVRRLEFWTKEEYDRFIGFVEKGSRYYLIFEILFWTGCRIGELLALTPADFDFQKHILHITKTYYRTDGRDIITTPKTKNSVRDIVLPNFLSDEISEYIKHRYEFPKDERLFPIGQEAVQHQMKHYIEISGVSQIPVHGLRHSATAFLISQGVQPMVIKERLGHKDIRVTLNTYGHLYPNEQQQLANMLDQLNAGNNNNVEGTK